MARNIGHSPYKLWIMVEIRTITEENKQDLLLKNEPFQMPGRLIPALENGKWRYSEEQFAHPESMCFPDEDYDFDMLSKDGYLLGAYENGVCVGLGIFRIECWRYVYVYDLKVSAAVRGRGIGKMLVDAGMEEARVRGYKGLYLYAQDNNLNACRFYLKTGFEIGGFDNRRYDGTSQEGKADIIFYKK